MTHFLHSDTLEPLLENIFCDERDDERVNLSKDDQPITLGQDMHKQQLFDALLLSILRQN